MMTSAELGTRLEDRHRARETAGQRLVVGIVECDVTAATRRDARVSRCADPAVRCATMRRRGSRMDASRARVSSVEPSSTTTTSKSTPVCGEQARDARLDQLGAIVGRHDHADDGALTGGRPARRRRTP
jgi:hypothetical protein